MIETLVKNLLGYHAVWGFVLLLLAAYFLGPSKGARLDFPIVNTPSQNTDIRSLVLRAFQKVFT